MWRRLLDSGWLDKIGITASFACAIHCIATPIIISFLPLAGVHFLEHDAHLLMLPMLMLPAVLSLIPGILLHKRIAPLVLSTIGIGIFSAIIFFHGAIHQHEILLSVISSTMLIIAHKLNHTYCKSCTKCDH